MAKLQGEVGDKLVDDVLLTAEAKRRKIQPNQAEISKKLDEYEKRYGKSPQWQSTRAKALPGLKKKFEEESILEQLQAQVRKVPQPTEKQVQAYYDQHKDKFTEPEQVKVSMILLRVDPSSPQAKWNAALDEGGAIAKRLRGGANFAELVRHPIIIHANVNPKNVRLAMLCQISSWITVSPTKEMPIEGKDRHKTMRAFR